MSALKQVGCCIVGRCLRESDSANINFLKRFHLSTRRTRNQGLLLQSIEEITFLYLDTFIDAKRDACASTMAPALTPRRLKQQRENQYFDVGVQGRYVAFC